MGVAFDTSLVLAPNVNDDAAAAGPGVPNAEALGTELNPPTLVALALGVALNENAGLTSVAAAPVAGAPNGDATLAAKLNAGVLPLLPPNGLAAAVFGVCDELPKGALAGARSKALGTPNDDAPKAGAAAGVDALPKTDSVFCGAAAVVEPNRFGVGVGAAVVTAAIPNGVFEPNAGVAVFVLATAVKLPKTGVAAGLLNVVVVDAVPNGDDAVVVVLALALLWLNDAPKLGIVVVVVATLLNDVLFAPKPAIGAAVVGVPNRFAAGVCVDRVNAVVLSTFAPNRLDVVVLAAAGAVAPKVKVLPGIDGAVVVVAGVGAPKDRPVDFGAPKLKVGVAELAVIVDAGATAASAAVVVAVKLNDGAANVGADDAVALRPFTLLPNVNVAGD